MVAVWSEAMVILTALGTEARNCVKRPLTRSTVSMTLAPGCLKIISKTEGLPSYKPAFRKSCTESTTPPRSESRTAAPFR